MNLTIREYRPEDLADVLSAWESGSRIAHPFLTEQFLDQERHNIPNLYLPNAETWVAEGNGQVVGFIALIDNEVGAIFVKSEFHHLGVGRALMDKAQALRGALEVEVFRENQLGRKFYSSYGFEFMAETVHEPTGNALLRLKFSPR
ncbi:MAG: putative acetyltransferase [Chloroflexi bacterium]|nr:MAG: putative acetyltransferase [Chloroflexota bacterium]